jgi:oxygen-dependent protoporphyrinogen oxidase
VSPADGLGPLPARLAERLGARVRSATAVRAVRARAGAFALECEGSALREVAARRVVLALPPAQAVPLLELPETQALGGFPSTPQTLVQFGLDDAGCARRWTGRLGFLSPSRERLPLLGCLFPNNLFPGRAPAGTLLLCVFAGPELRAASDAALARELAPLLARLLGSAREPELLDVARHTPGIPLYDRGHAQRLRALRAALADVPGLQLAGWGYDGIGLGAAAASGARAARALLDAH